MSEHPTEAIIGGAAPPRAAGPPQAPLDLANVKEGRHDHRVLPARPGIPPDPPVEIFDQKRIDPERQRLGQFPAEPPEPGPVALHGQDPPLPETRRSRRGMSPGGESRRKPRRAEP